MSQNTDFLVGEAYKGTYQSLQNTVVIGINERIYLSTWTQHKEKYSLYFTTTL